ncbi:MAG: DUF3078 domain-containing protein [Rikenellaceae bacterium]|nr:DUF3078 domain-containing protein [Rikenellaceae bacterium]
MFGPEYLTESMWAAERKRQRKDRNSFELNAAVQATQIYFSNWAAGGDNTFNGLSTLNMIYKYTKEKLSVTTRFDTRFGVSIIDTTVFKNEDKFELSSLIAWSINDNWSYSGRFNMRSQYMKGYKSRTNETLVSDFMSPGTIELGLGFTYNPKDSPWKIVISPLTGTLLFVLNDELSENGAHGIDPGKHVKPMGGPSVNINYRKKFAKDMLTFDSKFYSFYDFSISPIARWENKLDFTPVKFLTTSLYWLMIYDREAMPDDKKRKIQFNYSIGIGLSYTLKTNK